MKNNQQVEQQLSISLTEALNNYMRDLNGQPCVRLYSTTMERVEKQLLDFCLGQFNGNVSAAAKVLGISRTTLMRKIAAHGLRTNAHSARTHQRQR